MKATDLMIDDWVFSCIASKYVQVIELFGDYAKCTKHRRIASRDNEVIGDYKSLSPIELTSEILKKNGFLVGYKKAELIYYYIGYDFYLDLNGGEILLKRRRENSYDFTFDGIISCKYVHELQHVIKLCKIEKEIVL